MTDMPDEPDRLGDAPHPRETVRLFGQDEAEAAFLAASRSGRLHHGWLITGPSGVGKATLAWRIARHLLAGTTGASLQMEPDAAVFRQAAALAAPQLFLCRRPWDAKTGRLRKTITVDEVRALKGFFQVSAPGGGWRVALVDAADDLTASAANALLKILEEPPSRSLLLLVCHQPARLLPTLRSRCQTLRCRPLGPSDMAAALAQAGCHVEPGTADRLATLAAGSVGAAWALSRGGGLELHGEIAAALVEAPLDRGRAIAIAQACTGRGAEERYELTLDLIRISLERLARAAAGCPTPPVAEAEAALHDRLATGRAAAQLWSGLASDIVARTAHARAVNLDPGQVILDTFLRIDAAAAKARAGVS